MTTKWIDIPVGQPDDYLDIVEPDKWTLQAMVNLNNRTAGRFGFHEEDPSVYRIYYVNYTLGYNDTKIKIDADTGAAIMQERVSKLVVIS